MAAADPPSPTAASGDVEPAASLDRGVQRLNVSRRRAVGDIAVQVVARAGNLALGVVVTVIVVRALGARGFGEWSTILAIMQIAGSFGDLGLTQVAVSRAAGAPDAQALWLGALVELRVLLSVPIFLIELAVVLAIAPNAQVALAGTILSATAIVGAPAALSAAFQLRVRNDLTMVVITVNSVLWTTGAAIAATVTDNIVVFAVVFLVVQAVCTLLTVILALKGSRVLLAGARRLWREMLTVGLALGGAGILVTLYVRLDQVLVFQFAGARQAGLYAAAYRILDQSQFLPASVMTTLFPMIAACYPTDLPRVRRLLQTSAEYLSIMSLGALAFTIPAATQVMALLFHDQFTAAAPALPVLMGAFVSISFGYLAGSMVAILRLQRRFLIYAAIGLVLNATLNVALIPRYGFMAAAWTTLGTEVVVMSLSMHAVLRKLEMTPDVRRLIKIALVAAAMGGAVWFAGQEGAGLGGMVVVAVVVYPALLLATGALSVRDVLALVRRDKSGLDADQPAPPPRGIRLRADGRRRSGAPVE